MPCIAVFGWAASAASASASVSAAALAAPESLFGLAALAFFVIAYLLVMTEEVHHLRKSKPVLITAALIWALLAAEGARHGDAGRAMVEQAFSHTFLDFAELFAFLLVAMTYVNALTERQVFATLRAWLIQRRFGYRAVFWITGLCAFALSPFIDNMTTALIMGAVAITVGAGERRFIALCCINIVVAANASGAFSPFGDVTTLMVWQQGVLPFFAFFALFLPSIINWIVPAALMALALPRGVPPPARDEARLRPGAMGVVLLFAATIATTVSAHQFLGLPAVYGMLAGLGYLQLYGFVLHRRESIALSNGELGQIVPFDVFRQVALAEWDTLL
ncbi:MAG: sodium:proton antiporter, partial [Alphaproteobacteria bacterium]